MKVQFETEEVTSDGITDEGVFTIKSSAKAFSILSSGLYSNKYVAIIRELSCNAIDSHKEANKMDVQWRLHLPNRLEPELSIQDFGVGLDHDGVMNVYTTYFESTKTDSNDYIGALGLGSKSPFSYTKNFTITAIHDGVLRAYACHINAAGIPSIAKLGDDVETDECNGVEVKFAVDENDFAKWDDAVRETYKWFPKESLPIIVGRVVDIPAITYVDDGDVIKGIRICDNKHNTNGKPVAIQGNVAYPIDPPLVEIPEHLHSLLNVPFVINFDIGDLDVAASREELQYVPSTLNSIIAKFEQILTEFAAHAETEILAGKTAWDKVVIADRMIRESVFAPVVRQVVEGLNGKGRARIEVRGNIVGIVVDAATCLKNKSVIGIDFHQMNSPKRYRGKDHFLKAASQNELFGSPRGNMKIFVDDLNRGGTSRLKQAVRGEKSHEHQLSSGKTVVTIKVDFDNSRAVGAISRMFGGMKVVKTSDLPRVVYYNSGQYGKREPGEKINFLELYEWSSGRWSSDSEYRWNSRSVDLNEYMKEHEYVYFVELKNKTVLRNDEAVDKQHFSTLIYRLKECDFLDKDMPIIGVRQRNVDVLNSKCINLFDFVEKKLALFNVRRMQRTNVYKAAWNHCDWDEKILDLIMKHLLKSSHLGQFVKKVQTGSERNDVGADVDSLRSIAHWIHGSDNMFKTLDDAKAKEEGRAMWEGIVERYSLIPHIESRSYSTSEHARAREIAKYIKMVDTLAKMQDNSNIETEVA